MGVERERMESDTRNTQILVHNSSLQFPTLSNCIDARNLVHLVDIHVCEFSQYDCNFAFSISFEVSVKSFSHFISSSRLVSFLALRARHCHLRTRVLLLVSRCLPFSPSSCLLLYFSLCRHSKYYSSFSDQQHTKTSEIALLA